MSLSSDISTYTDIRILLDEALTSENGVAAKLATEGKARYMRQRCYRFRDLVQNEGDFRYNNLRFEYVPYADGTHWLKITHIEPLLVVKL